MTTGIPGKTGVVDTLDCETGEFCEPTRPSPKTCSLTSMALPAT